MREASAEKFDRVCRRLDLSPDDQLLEIGSGWGGFAIHAASRYGATVTTTTIKLKDSDPLNPIGKAVIFHQGSDDGTSQPTGDAGTRAACGILQKQ